MKFYQKTCFAFQLFLFVSATKVKSDVLTVHLGEVAVLHCVHSTENFSIVTWTMDFHNKSSCYLSTMGNATEESCNGRMHLDIDNNKTSLRIHSSTVFDEGNYTCQIVNKSGTFLYTVALQVLVKPFLSMKTDENGNPECRAVGGKPAANISWTPESTDDVKTRSNRELNGTTTVISSYNTSNKDVTCIVSHPTFTSPMERRLSKLTLGAGGNNLILILCIITVLVLLLGLILFSKRSNLRTCLNMKHDSSAARENPVVMVEEVEPYASFTETVNTIYSSTYDLAEYKQKT
ncbi:cell surface glycoprotein CD200 receptor 1-B-like [Bufo gargarizans]|uniref:cell surface glycoprotein CD200 receptor 1-B-like n=1 Tax=Bufo gargarizans TaxID=30331 RepID=UPI001CF30B0B|nr:cell surface glycoprotein CD200 receptor 1-B-like [Bufo gargarizans]